MDAKELVSRIVDEVQTEAKKVTGFNHGALKILIITKCGLATTYLKAFGTNPKIDLGFVIGKGFMRPAGWRGYESNKELDCNANAAINIALLDRSLDEFDQRHSSENTAWGPVVKGGCAAFDIFISERDSHLELSGPKPYLRILISVSGAEDEENEVCALAARKALNHLCNSADLNKCDFGYEAESVFYLTVSNSSI
jgi:hypothetical protein